jgi:hypothetical protein
MAWYDKLNPMEYLHDLGRWMTEREGADQYAQRQRALEDQERLRDYGQEERTVFEGWERNPDYVPTGNAWQDAIGGMRMRTRKETPLYGPYQKDPVQLGEDARRAEVNAALQRQLDLSEGRGPSLAAQQYAAANQDTQAGLMSMAAGGRGAQGARFAAQQRARVGAGMASGIAEARTREQMAAMQQYNQGLSNAQQADYAREALNAQLQQQQQQGNQAAWLQQEQMRRQMELAHQQAGKGQTNAGKLWGIVGTGVGAYLGGPQGAQAGGAVGTGIADIGGQGATGTGAQAPVAAPAQQKMFRGAQPGYAPSANNTIRTGPPIRQARRY